MNVEIVEFLEDQGYIWVSTKEHFEEHYSKNQAHKYSPVPNEEPESYPCMVKHVDYIYNDDAADEFIMSYIYF